MPLLQPDPRALRGFRARGPHRLRERPARSARRPRGLRPDLDRRLGRALGGGAGGLRRHGPGGGRQREHRSAGRARDPRAGQRRGDGRARASWMATCTSPTAASSSRASTSARPTRPSEFIARLKAFAAERRPGEWILGGDWDHERWPGAPLPRREWIDSVTPNNPVFVNRLDGHMGLANSAALRAAKISRATRDIPGGVIVRDPRTGEPTGVLKDEAMGPVERAMPAPTDQQRDAALRRALAYAASKGVTAFAPHERGARRPRHLPAGQGGWRPHRPRRALLPAGGLARGGGHHRGDRPRATTGCGSAA